MKLSIVFLSSLIFIDATFAAVRPYSSTKSIPKIKVRIGKALRNVVISGTDLGRKLHFRNEEKTFKGRKEVRFLCQNKTEALNRNGRPLLLATVGSKTGLVTLGQEKYMGNLHVITTPENDSCDVINEIDIENYISTLLPKEMNASWPLEALKAQAVAARTYALHKIESKQVSKKLGHNAHYDLENTEKHQVSGGFFDATTETLQAARETQGYVLMSESGELTPTFFHAHCGGKTLRPDQVWENAVEGYQSVRCPYCNEERKGPWEKTITISRFKNFLDWATKEKYVKKEYLISSKTKLRFVPDNVSKTKLRIYIDDEMLVLNKSLLRRYFGRVLFPSNHYEIDMKWGQLVVKGKGNGHGVGLCQVGALGLAKRGWSYNQILAHYFPKHELKKIY